MTPAMTPAKLDALFARHKGLIADISKISRINSRRRADARPPAPLAKADATMDIRALVSPTGQLLAYVGPISEPMTKARPKPAGRRSAPPPRDWLGRIAADQQEVETSLTKTRIRAQIQAGRAQVERGEIGATEAAKLDVITGRAAALGVWP